jgi:hypothetical protein
LHLISLMYKKKRTFPFSRSFSRSLSPPSLGTRQT